MAHDGRDHGSVSVDGDEAKKFLISYKKDAFALCNLSLQFSHRAQTQELTDSHPERRQATGSSTGRRMGHPDMLICTRAIARPRATFSESGHPTDPQAASRVAHARAHCTLPLRTGTGTGALEGC